MLDGRLSVDFTWFKAATTDALFSVRNVPSNGFLASSLMNAGKMEKSGIEVAILATLVDRPLFGVTAGLNVSTNKSKVVSLGGAPSSGIAQNAEVIFAGVG